MQFTMRVELFKGVLDHSGGNTQYVIKGPEGLRIYRQVVSTEKLFGTLPKKVETAKPHPKKRPEEDYIVYAYVADAGRVRPADIVEETGCDRGVVKRTTSRLVRYSRRDRL
jgi:hypothetical protein